MIVHTDMTMFSTPGRVFEWSLTLRNDSSRRSPKITGWKLDGSIRMSLSEFPYNESLKPFDIRTFKTVVTTPQSLGASFSTLTAQMEDGTEIQIPVKIEVTKPRRPLYFSPDADPMELFA